MKKHLLRTMYLLTIMVLGSITAWAYTPTLTAEHTVAGYKAKAYYNIATENANSICPESGDLRFRGSGYGLFNFGSGNRGCDLTLSVAEGDLLLAEFKDSQNRSVTINSISSCTKNDNFTDGEILAFDVTADATTLNINIGRGGCIIAFFVMEKDASVSTAPYTINYLLNGEGEPIKTVSGEIAVGTSVATDASFFVNDVKYFRTDGQPESVTVASENNTFNVNVRLAATYNYSLASNLGVTLNTGSGFEGESIRAGYPRFQLADGKLYEASVDNKEYRKTIILTADNASGTIDYTEKADANAVFFSEAESLEGVTVVTNDNIPVRASNAKAATSSEDITITTLPAGKYKFHAGIFTSKSKFIDAEEKPYTVNFGIGESTFAAAFTAVNLTEVASEEYTLSSTTEIKYLGTSTWADAQFDYIWIEKTGDVPFDLANAITNADFSADEAIAAKVCTYAKDVTEGQVANMQPLTGWTIVENGDARAAGTFAYGSGAILGGDGGTVPAVGPNGETEGKALGIEAVWSATTQYTQEITLPAGEYLMEAVIYNAAGTGALASNLIGIDGTYSTIKNYPVGKWTKDQIKITLAEEKTVTVSIGVNSGNVGNGSAPHLFIDHVKLYGSNEIAAIELAAAKENALVEVNSLPVGDALFLYAEAAINTAKSAIEAATTIEDVNTALAAVKASMTKPATDKEYVITNKTAELALSIGNEAVKIEKEGIVKFTEVEGGWVLSNNAETPEYIFKTTANTWTFSTTANKDEAYIVNFNLADGAYTIQGANGMFGTDNTAEGSIVYANKAQSNNGLWTIAEYVAPAPVKTDYTEYIVNANLTGEGGFDAAGTKGIDGSGIVKVGNASAFDFKQTIENLPAGKYKVTAQAAYRYGADEQAEYDAILAETQTKLVQLYATVGEKTVAQPVQNRWDGASETDLAGEGAVLINGKYVPNSSNAVKAWFNAGQYVNEVEFNLSADGAVTIGINRISTPASDYTVIGPWTLTRLGDAEAEPEPEPEVQPGQDMTKYIVNPSFETGDLTGWTVGNSSDTGVRENSNDTYKTEGCDGDYVFNTWWQGIPITQTIKNIPNGVYELKALMTSDAGDHLFLIANGQHSEVFGSPNGKGEFVEQSMQFYVTDETATIGAIGGNEDGTYNEAGYFWYKADNFRLTYVNTLPKIEDIEIPEGKMSVAAANAITTAKEAGDVVALIQAANNAKSSIAAYAKMKSVLDLIAEEVAKTNVYTAAAKATYDENLAAAKKGYDEGTISDADASAFNYGSRLEGLLPTLLLSAYTSTVEGKPYINSWSTEGNNDGSNFKTPFYEYWVGDGESLATNTITAEMTGLEAGDYDVTALVRVRMKNDAEAPATGITLQANDGEAVNVAAGDQIGESQFFMKEFTATGTVADDGVLKIKFDVAADNNISWLSFKNVKFEKQIVLTPVMTLKGTIGEEVSLTFGVYDSEDTFSVDFGDGQLQSAKVGINNAGPVKEDGNTAAATVFTGKVAGDGTITVYGKNDIWYLVANGAMPTTFDQAKLMNVVQMTISSANVETVELPAYEKMTQFSFTNSPVKSVDISKVVGLTRIDIFNTTQSAYEPQLESIDVSKNVNLETIVLGGNTYKKGQITALDFTNNTKLNQISAENNKIVSVTNIPVSVKNIYLSNNELASLTFPEFTAKGTIQIQNNKFTLATLPTKPAITTASKYTYAPQPAYAVAESVAELDLSSQLTATGILTEPATTTYSFVTTSGTALVEGTDYEVTEPGKFKFLTAQTEKVHGVMANEAFPKFTGANAYVTTEFTVMEPVKPIEGISYSWESPAGTPIQWGGTIAYVNGEGDRLNYQNSGFYTICLNGKKANINDETASANAGKMVITLDKALAEGDTIAYTAYVNKNQSKNASAYILFENGTDAEGEVFGDEANIDATFNGVPTLKYTVVPAEAAGSKTITLTRSQTGTNLFITKLQVIEKKAEPVQTELAQELNVERYPGLGYGVTEATVDFTEAKAFLGVEEITTDMLHIVNPDGTMISDYATYDGWFNGEGAAETWGANTKVCVKFFQAIPEGTYQICDMNGADEVGKTYTVKWALEANDKKVTYTINVKFIEKPVITLTYADLNKVDEQTVALTSELGKCYEGMTADVNVAAILAKLGVESLSDVTIYAVQSNGTLDDNYKVGNTDGWRNATGDWQTWGADAYFYVKANFALESAQLYEIGGMDGHNTTAEWENPASYTATYAFVKTGTADAVVLKVTLTYTVPTGINAINRDAQNTVIYNVNGQKMNKAQKGLNIINGKKVVIK